MFVLEGLFYGLATLFIIGPVVFILINATLKNGAKSGIAVAFGIFLGDLIYAVLCIKGIDKLINSSFLDKYLSIIGFVILFSFGIIYTFKKNKPTIKKDNNSKTHFQNFLKGFGINFFNPFVLSFWVLISKYGINKYENNVLYFLFALVFGILLIDIVKVFLAKKLNPLLNSNKLFLFYKFSGVIMILFSF